jgi:class 3 adenylate cyclase
MGLGMLSRLAPLDKALVLILVPIWVVCFTLGVRKQVRGGGTAVLGLSVEDALSYPALTGEFARFIHPFDPLAEAGLRAGDRLIRLGDADLRGVGTLGFTARAHEQGERVLSVPLVFEREGERRETSLALADPSIQRPVLAVSFAFAASALFLLLRARLTTSVRAYFYLGMCWALTSSNFSGSPLLYYAWYGIFVAGNTVLFPLTFHFLFRFPDNCAPEGRWHRIWPWFFAVNGLFTALIFSSWSKPGQIGSNATIALGVVAILAVATRKYLRTDLVARRQMKWVLFGIYCAALPPGLAAAVSAYDPRLGWLYFPSFWAVPLCPLFGVISIVRFNLFDIDRLLSVMASYNILLVLLVGGGLVVVPRMAEAASALVGIDPGTGQVVLSLLLAAVLIPAHRRLRPRIDRVFFKERYSLDQGIAQLLPTLSTCPDGRELTARVGSGLHGLLRPEVCVVYTNLEESYAPVFVKGRAVPSAFEADSPLIGTLRGRRAPLSLSDAGRYPDEAPLGPFDRAALETLQAEVVVPVRQDDALVAFLCLGPKGSGDVYTSTDLSLLTAVAEKMATELRRFDQEVTVREAREMQESLRRVDIRSYTTYTEGKQARDIFSTINRYTQTVSAIVEKFGGSVVEFNGDGMMAVFGAPTSLPDKERAAVSAGREIITKVQGLGGTDESGTISVGVGVATGSAFVGSIQAVDRMIWTALGNTTNLAARLQGLTRDLDAAMVIDLATWRAAGEPPEFQRREQVAIRGRSQREDVYVLALASGAAA